MNPDPPVQWLWDRVSEFQTKFNDLHDTRAMRNLDPGPAARGACRPWDALVRQDTLRWGRVVELTRSRPWSSTRSRPYGLLRVEPVGHGTWSYQLRTAHVRLPSSLSSPTAAPYADPPHEQARNSVHIPRYDCLAYHGPARAEYARAGGSLRRFRLFRAKRICQISLPLFARYVIWCCMCYVSENLHVFAASSTMNRCEVLMKVTLIPARIKPSIGPSGLLQ